MTKHFLQSQEWEGFQRSLGREVVRVSDILVVKLPLMFGKSYLYSAGSEIAPPVEKTRSITRRGSAIFFKFEPMSPKSTGSDPVDFGFRKSDKEIQPQKTIILDVTKPEEELLEGMHKKTRYNIRLAAKQGVKIRSTKHEIRNKSQILNSNPQNYFGGFCNLIQKTAERDKFSSHTKEYYEKLLELPFVKLFVAEHKGEIIAANIILFYGNRTTYLHGASDYSYRNFMAPYLLHWETIKYAKEKGFAEYDFWGIDEKKWPGVTRFKRGFGGREVEYIGSYDHVFQKAWYGVYRLRSMLRNKS